MPRLSLLVGWKAKDVLALALSPDGQTVATGHGSRFTADPGHVTLWDRATGNERARLEGYPHPIHAVAYSPDGKQLAYAGGGGAIELVDTTDLRNTATLRGPLDLVRRLAFSPDSATLAATGWTTGNVFVWDLPRGRQVATLGGHTPHPASLAIAPDGASIAVGENRGIVLWSQAGQGWDRRRVPYPVRVINDLQYHPSGNKIALCTQGDLAVYDVAKDKLRVISKINYGGYTSVCYVQDGTVIASGGFALKENEEIADISLWDSKTRKVVSNVKRGRGADINWFSYSPAANVLAAVDTKSRLSTWALTES